MTKKTLLLVVLIAALVGSSSVADVLHGSIDLPRDGAVLNRTHVQVRWDTFARSLAGPPRGGYTLEIVADDGSEDPFGSGASITEVPVAGTEPRTIVTAGLTFDADYAWRVRVAGEPAGARVSAVRRFSTAALSPYLPELNLIVPDGAAPVQPGLTCWTSRRAGLGDRGFIFCVDPAGQLVLQFVNEGALVGDMRLMDNGRFLFVASGPDSLGQTCRRANVKTLDGKRTWQSPTDHCDAPFPFPQMGVHHEVFPMPPSAPRGANFMTLEFDNRRLDFVDIHDGETYTDHHFYFDRVNEFDRHTNEVVKTWTSFDAVCLDDHLGPNHNAPWGSHAPGVGPLPDIHHGNAVVYDEVWGRIAVSLRRITRILVVDWESGETIYHMGDIHDEPGVPLPCGDVAIGDNLYSTQHAPEFQSNGNMLVYDNGNYLEPLSEPRWTRVVELAFDNPLDPTDVWIEREFRLVAPDLESQVFAFFVGDADRMPNGNTLTCDGRHATIQEFDPNGDVNWYLEAGPTWPGTGDGDPVTAGTQIYRVEKVPELIVDTPGDSDGDWDLDLHDLAALQLAFPANAPLAFPESLLDVDRDGTLGARDVNRFAYWMTGPGY